MTYEFEVSVPFESFYKGILEVEAGNYQAALDIVKKLSKDEIDEKTSNWEIDLISTVSNPDNLKVYDQQGNILN